MLLGYEKFDIIFNEIIGKKVYFVSNLGWTGDCLIDDAARQLFKHYEIKETSIEEADYFIESGGGNLGNGYYETYLKRKKILDIAMQQNKKVIILPKSFYGNIQEIPNCIYKLYAREKITKVLIKQSILAPDLALGYKYKGEITKPINRLGLFIRDDENLFNGKKYENNLGDPRRIIEENKLNFNHLFKLAMDYEIICTDRLHFAIASMIIGRKVILMPNSYFKNYGMWLTWLRELGCEWIHSPEELYNNIIIKSKSRIWL
jgi:exopolysaccharide biosynthesis predicted pyruvyltransferase EpsI